MRCHARRVGQGLQHLVALAIEFISFNTLKMFSFSCIDILFAGMVFIDIGWRDMVLGFQFKRCEIRTGCSGTAALAQHHQFTAALQSILTLLCTVGGPALQLDGLVEY